MNTSEPTQHPRIEFKFHPTQEERDQSEAWQFFDEQRLTPDDLDIMARLDDLKRKGLRQPHEL